MSSNNRSACCDPEQWIEKAVDDCPDEFESKLFRNLDSASKQPEKFRNAYVDFYSLRFKDLADKWELETGFLSITTQKFAHPAYREILDMKQAAVPLILRRLKHKGGHWLPALKLLVGRDIVDHRKGITNQEKIDSWIAFGSRHNLI